jgi:hypothetical protein
VTPDTSAGPPRIIVTDLRPIRAPETYLLGLGISSVAIDAEASHLRRPMVRFTDVSSLPEQPNRIHDMAKLEAAGCKHTSVVFHTEAALSIFIQELIVLHTLRYPDARIPSVSPVEASRLSIERARDGALDNFAECRRLAAQDGLE